MKQQEKLLDVMELIQKGKKSFFIYLSDDISDEEYFSEIGSELLENKELNDLIPVKKHNVIREVPLYKVLDHIVLW